MNSSSRFSRILAWACGGLFALGAIGCANLFVARHKVLVDSITAPGTAKPSGMSYRLIAKKSVLTQSQVQMPVVKACVDAALSGIGMFEPPPSAAPDMFVEVSYGVDTAGRVDPASRETFVQLSARENPGRSLDRPTGQEVWDVRVAVLGIAGRVETALPMLCAVAASYIASDTHMETKVEILQNDARIMAVREMAIRALEGNASVRPGPAEAKPSSDQGTANATPATNTPAGTTPGGSVPPAR